MAKRVVRKTRRNGIRKGPEQTAMQDQFLDAFEKVATIHGAAQQCGMNRTTHYQWLKNDPAYRARFEASDEVATERLEQEARRRAMVGVEEPVYYRGDQVGAVRKYSDVLLIFLLKARRPEKYRERYDVKGDQQHDVTVTFGGRHKPNAQP